MNKKLVKFIVIIKSFFYKKKRLLIFIIIFLFICLFIQQSSNYKKDKKKTKDNLEEKEPKIDSFFLKGIEKQILIWELMGEYAILNFENDRNKLKIINPKIYFYDKKDKDILRQKEKNVIAWMTSKNAIINVYTKDMHAYNDVVMFSNTQNIKLTTEEVFYDNEKDLFYSHKFVSIVQGDNLTEGIGFDAKSDLSQINIKKDVIIKYLKKDTKIE